MSLLDYKYGILHQEANTRANLAQTEGLVNTARAAAIPIEGRANAAAAYAGANKTTQEAGQVTPLARSEIGLRGAQGNYYGAETKNIMAQHDPANLDFGTLVHHARSVLGYPDEPAPSAGTPLIGIAGPSQPASSPLAGPYASYRSILDGGPMGATPDEIQDQDQDAVGHASGTSKIPGEGSGKVDTVPAMLAPGEAVLNKGAAEHMGRGMIKQLNDLGLAKMGVAQDAKSGSAKPPKGKPGLAKGGMLSYAWGIDEVPATPATPATQATQGGIKPQKHAKGTSDVKGAPSSKAPLSGDGDTVNQRNAALKADPRGVNNDTIAVHQPSMLHGMQMMAAAMGMLPARKGFSKGTAKVTKGKGGKSAPAQMAPPGGGGPLGLSPDMTAVPPGGAPSPEQINPLLMALSQQPQVAAA